MEKTDQERQIDRLNRLRLKCLLLGDPKKMLKTENPYHEEWLGATLSDIQDYIFHCYDLGDNPLRHLRKTFPNFEWSLERPRTDVELYNLAHESDYLFLRSNTDWTSGVVRVAWRSGGRPHSICYLVEDGGPAMYKWAKILSHAVSRVRFVRSQF